MRYLAAYTEEELTGNILRIKNGVFGMLRRVALVRTDVSEESGASFIRVTRIGELGTTQTATSNRRTLRRNARFFRNVGSYKSHTA
jgi:hypothetical protein